MSYIYYIDKSNVIYNVFNLYFWVVIDFVNTV